MIYFGLGIAASVIAIDQLSKFAVLSVLDPYQGISVTPFLNLVLVLNTGITFGFFASDDSLTRWTLIVLALIISLILVRWLATAGGRYVGAALGMIIGGALGNVIDRLVHKAVVDFFDFHLYAWHWPAFNIADSAITIGVALFVLSSLLERRGHDKRGIE